MTADQPAIDDRTSGRRRLWAALPTAVVVLGVGLSILAGVLLAGSEGRVEQASFEAETVERVLELEQSLSDTTAAIEDLSSLYRVAPEVSSEVFATFADPLLTRRPALRALSWNPVIRQDQRAAHEASMRASGFAEYAIVERDAGGGLVPAAERDEYVVVATIAPPQDNRRAVGFDLASEPTPRQALERARDTGGYAVAVPIDLVQVEGAPIGALGFLPRYRPGAPTATIEDRRAAVIGYFVAVVEVADLIEASPAGRVPRDLAMQLSSTGAESGEVLLYSSGSSADFPRDLESSASVTWGGQELLLRFGAGRGYGDHGHTLLPIVLALAGVVVSLLAGATAHLLQRRSTRVEREVARRTEELVAGNAELESEVRRRVDAEKALEVYRDELERQVGERTAELEYTSNQLRTIVDSEPECVKLLSAQGTLLDMNPAGLRMIEADSLDQVRGLSVYDLVVARDRPAFVELNERVMAGESGILEFELRGIRGTVRRLETHAVPLMTSEGGPPLHLAVTRDITARVRAEEERLELEAQLRQSQKLESVGLLAGGIAHDFNNLLHVISGNVDMARRGVRGDAPGLASLDAAGAAVAEAAKLCDQMLTYAGESRPDKRPVSLASVVRSMADLLEAARAKNVRLDVDVDADHLASVISGDDAQLGQVVVNLVTNASDAIGSAAGVVRVSVRRIDIDGHLLGRRWLDAAPPPGPYVCLEVADNGAGIDAETIEKIFDPFYTTKFAGRGLGLSSTLGVIRGHAGYISVESDVGVGSTFTVVFPPSADRPAPPAPATPVHDARFEGTVLVVDDDEQIRTVCGQILESLGLSVETASDGAEAVGLFEQRPDAIDVVLLDVTMPGMNGNRAAELLRAIRAQLPIIFCSGYTADVALDSMTDPALTYFLQKPYRVAELVHVLVEADRDACWSRSRRAATR